ncbi:MAG: MoaD/ThiS family protein [Deltaproteobacteria bacterium]|nr:MoaD/ThiS family protein [Deltaproteobacteria bacterium]MBI2500680.1 MoaD/ThiS family protein [Deltaproteobacteria bacterium]
MSVKVRIPTPLQKLTTNKAEVSAAGGTVKEILVDLERQYPGVKERIYDEKGSLRRFINFYVNNEDIRFLKGEATPIKDGDEISIVPAIAGGR